MKHFTVFFYLDDGRFRSNLLYHQKLPVNNHKKTLLVEGFFKFKI